ncbi:MAG: hypothetical protein Q4G25_16740 [Paracoccus sp. (in: a-proteobacteria)]|nr:hypothetical protein [Paracoccus sp. (in: a-proteobacteria)]
MDRARGSYTTMSQRAEPRDALDDFPTPPWATRALCEALRDYIGQHSVREPAANRGYMARPLAEYFRAVEASDIHDYGAPPDPRPPRPAQAPGRDLHPAL